MLLCVIPITAYAETTVSTYEQLWKAFYAKQDSITLTSDIKYTVPDGGNQPLAPYQFLLNVSGDSNVTLDLNGFTLTVSNDKTTWPTQSALFSVEGNASLTVMNGTVDLYNYNNSARTDAGIFDAKDNAYLTLTNVDATNRRSGVVVSCKHNSTVNLEGGTITAGAGFAVSAIGNCSLNLDKNVKLTTTDGSGVVTQFSNAGQGSLHSETPNLTVISATLKAGVEVAESSISQFTPSNNKLVFVEGTQYYSAFNKTKSGNYYWSENTGGFALIENSGNTIFAKNIQIVSKSSKQTVRVENGTASPNYAAFGDSVTVTAKSIAGKEFTRWLILKGDISISNEALSSKQATFTMGADPVELKAVYDNGYEKINTIDFKLKTPANGQALPAATTTAEGVTVEDTWWIELYDGGGFSNVLPANYKFEAGHTYRAGVNIKLASNYILSDSVAVTFTDPSTNKKTTAVEGATNKIWLYEYTIPDLLQLVALNATVSGIKAGAAVSTLNAQTYDTHYTAAIYGIFDTDNPFSASSNNQLSASAKLEGGKTYVAAVIFTPGNDYKIANGAGATINGKDGKIGATAADNKSKIFYAVFAVPEPEPVPVIQNGWNNEYGFWMYFENGKAVTGWKYIGGKWYFFDTEGIMKTGWVNSGGKWYYMRSSGAMATGWIQSGGKWYYMSSSGAMTTGWVKSGGVWYYMNSSGAMVTGWQKIGSVWYYFQSSGAMQTGWSKISGSWYYFESNGAMLANTSRKIGSKTYKFNSSGVCLNP